MDLRDVKKLMDDGEFYNYLLNDDARVSFLECLYKEIDSTYMINIDKINSIFRMLQKYKAAYEKEKIYSLYDYVYLSSDIEGDVDEDNVSEFYSKLFESILNKESGVASANGYFEYPSLKTLNRVNVMGKWENVFDLDIATPFIVMGYGNGSLKLTSKINRRAGFNRFFVTMLPRATVKVWLSDYYGRALTDKVTDGGLIIFDIGNEVDDVYLNIEDEGYFSHVISIFDIGFMNTNQNDQRTIVFDLDGITFTSPNIIFNKFGGGASNYSLVNKNDINDVFGLKDGENILPERFISVDEKNVVIGSLFTYDNVLLFLSKIKYIPFMWVGNDTSPNVAIYPLEDITLISNENVSVDIIGYGEKYLSVAADTNEVTLLANVLYRISGASSYEFSSDNYKMFHYDRIYFIGKDYKNSIEHQDKMVYLIDGHSNIVINRDYNHLKYFYVDLSNYNLVIECNGIDSYNGFMLAENVLLPVFATIAGLEKGQVDNSIIALCKPTKEDIMMLETRDEEL